MQEILSDEIDDADFAIDNLEELSSYIINGNLNIRIHRDITGDMWGGYTLTLKVVQITGAGQKQQSRISNFKSCIEFLV